MLSSSKIADWLEGTEGNAHDPLVVTPLQGTANGLRDTVGSSIDLRLGRWFLSKKAKNWSLLDVYSNEDRGLNELGLAEKHFIPFDRSFILHPRSFVLGITLEWIRIPRQLTASVTGKSSWGRRGVIVETAPGVHPGFSGCLTLEMTNVGEIPIAIKPGDTICQLSFNRLEGPNEGNASGQFIGNRQPTLGSLKPKGIHSKP